MTGLRGDGLAEWKECCSVDRDVLNLRLRHWFLFSVVIQTGMSGVIKTFSFVYY
jgi:hypothetical protein